MDDKQAVGKQTTRKSVKEMMADAGMVAGQVLEEIDLSGIDFSELAGGQPRFFGLNMSRADLSKAGLAGAVIAGVNLERSDLTGARLANATVAGTNLDGASFRDADLHGARIFAANLNGADFGSADLRRTIWVSSNVSGAKFEGARLDGARSIGVGWQTAGIPPAQTPASLLSVPEWLPPAALAVGVLLLIGWLWGRRNRG